LKSVKRVLLFTAKPKEASGIQANTMPEVRIVEEQQTVYQKSLQSMVQTDLKKIVQVD
jgi:hypothetical protein